MCLFFVNFSPTILSVKALLLHGASKTVQYKGLLHGCYILGDVEVEKRERGTNKARREALF